MYFDFGISELIPNAIIEVAERTGVRSVLTSQLGDYEETIIRKLTEEGIKVIRTFSRNETNSFILDCQNEFQVIENGKDICFTLRPNVTTEQLRSKYRVRLPLKILKVFSSDEVIKSLINGLSKMYNNPFFTNIPDVGDLNWEEIIVDDTYPIFFTLISEKGQRYISICCELYEEQRWVIAPISNIGLIELLTNKLSMRDAFFTQSSEECIIAHWSKDNPVLQYEIAAPNELPEQDLPLDEMLESEDGEFEEYIQKIKDSESKSV